MARYRILLATLACICSGTWVAANADTLMDEDFLSVSITLIDRTLEANDPKKVQLVPFINDWKTTIAGATATITGETFRFELENQVIFTRFQFPIINTGRVVLLEKEGSTTISDELTVQFDAGGFLFITFSSVDLDKSTSTIPLVDGGTIVETDRHIEVGSLFAPMAPAERCCINITVGSLPEGALKFQDVPGPIVGAGLPGLILASGALLALGRRRRKVA